MKTMKLLMAFAMLVFRLLGDGDKYVKVLVPRSAG